MKTSSINLKKERKTFSLSKSECAVLSLLQNLESQPDIFCQVTHDISTTKIVVRTSIEYLFESMGIKYKCAYTAMRQLRSKKLLHWKCLSRSPKNAAVEFTYTNKILFSEILK